MRALWRRSLDLLFSIGAYPEESPEQASKRRIYLTVGMVATLLSIPFVFDTFDRGYTLDALATAAIVLWEIPNLWLLHIRPRWYPWIVNGTFALVSIGGFYSTWLFGGFVQGGIEVVFGLIIAIGALMFLGRRAAIFWFAVFVVSVVFAIVIDGRVEPTYVAEEAASESGLNLIAAGVVIMAATLYFVRERDRFQRQSDDLLHNILPSEIAARLKTDRVMIADDFPHASVLFADVVGFTPLSATMTPPQLVGLLNDVFTTFDEFAEDLGCEKVKTVGDEYMVAAGVPVPRDDHAEAIADLALRIRNHVATNHFDGHRLTLRIGINSGPVVAGIIGTHKFSYDMWGDTVNTASRMESSGVPGEIQVSPTTHELLTGNGYHLEPRGTIDIKGKGPMNTWLLTRRS